MTQESNLSKFKSEINSSLVSYVFTFLTEFIRDYTSNAHDRANKYTFFIVMVCS